MSRPGAELKSAKPILLFAVAVVILGALIAPWLFWAVRPVLPEVPFKRVFHRSLMIVALVGLWPLLRSLGIRSWAAVGFVAGNAWWRHVLVGVGLGVGSFTLAGMLLLATGMRTLEWPATVGLAPLGFVATAVAVAFLEELFFRGGIQGALQRSLRVPAAIAVASAIYSGLHFFKPKGARVAAEAVDWLSGFDYLGQVLARSWQAPGVVVGFVTLFLAGWILGLTFARTRALYLAMGIHAGWVFTLKTFAWMTDAGRPRAWWGGGALVDNMLVWPVLIALLVVVNRLCRSKIQPLQA